MGADLVRVKAHKLGDVDIEGAGENYDFRKEVLSY
jgi:hypothetical protein